MYAYFLFCNHTIQYPLPKYNIYKKNGERNETPSNTLTLNSANKAFKTMLQIIPILTILLSLGRSQFLEDPGELQDAALQQAQCDERRQAERSRGFGGLPSRGQTHPLALDVLGGQLGSLAEHDLQGGGHSEHEELQVVPRQERLLASHEGHTLGLDHGSLRGLPLGQGDVLPGRRLHRQVSHDHAHHSQDAAAAAGHHLLVCRCQAGGDLPAQTGGILLCLRRRLHRTGNFGLRGSCVEREFRLLYKLLFNCVCYFLLPVRVLCSYF